MTAAQQAIQDSGFTAEELGRQVHPNLSAAYIKKLARRGGASPLAAERLARALKCSPSIFLFRINQGASRGAK